jgi:hypothetical protein
MLQCLSILVSVQSQDDTQFKMEQLAKTLKWNWLGGRGRTGRQRRGFVGTKIRTGAILDAGNSSVGASDVHNMK